MIKVLVKIQLAAQKFKEERGATTVEYALIVGGIVAIVLGAVQLLGGGITTLFTNLKNTISGA